MAANSKREQIISQVVTTLESVESIVTVDRKPLEGISALSQYASTQLPLAVVLGKLPEPESKKSGRDRTTDVFTSNLGVDVIVYAMDNVTPDVTISTLADDVWASLWNQVLPGSILGFPWVIDFEIKPDAASAVWDPYLAFRMFLNIKYLHNTGGI